MASGLCSTPGRHYIMYDILKRSRLFSFRKIFQLVLCWTCCTFSIPVSAATNLDFTVNASEAVTVNTAGGTPRLQLDIGGVTRYASYVSGSGTAALTFTYTTQAGDLDLNGLSVSSPLQLNGATITDASGNAMSPLTFTVPTTSGVIVDHPSLSMDFTANDYILNGTHYNSLSSFLTASGGSFARASVGTYFDSAGIMQTAASGAARFDHDPVTHQPKGILIEVPRTNLLLQTAAFASNWTLSGATIAASPVMAPNNSAAFRVTARNGTYQYGIYGNNLAVAAGTYTFSFYVRYVNRQWLWVRGDFPQATWAAFDIQNGVLGNKDAGVSTTTITPVGNGWYRCTSTFATSGTGGAFNVVLQTGTGSTPTNAGVVYTGTEAFDVFGPQLELGTAPTSFISTTATSATRAGDNLYVTAGSWFSNTAGTIQGVGDYTAAASSPSGVFALNDNGVNNRIDYRAGQAQAMISGSGSNSSIGSLIFPQGVTNKIVVSYSASSFKASLNGAAVASAGPQTPVGINRLWVGNIDSGNYWLNGHVARLRYYPVQTADAQLQLLSQ